MGKSRNKGNRLEQSVGKWLQENDDVCPMFGEIASSTWRLGHMPNLQIDVVSKRYAVECKSRKKLPKYIIDAYVQIIEQSKKHNKNALLVLKADYKPLMHCITPERHAELLKNEKEINNEYYRGKN